jgi:hypothetical protein
MLAKAPLRKKRNFKNLTLEESPVIVQAADGSPAASKSGKSLEEYSQFCERLSDLEIGLELRLDLRNEDFSELDELGRGNGGTVCKVLHVRTKTVMAKKVSNPHLCTSGCISCQPSRSSPACSGGEP